MRVISGKARSIPLKSCDDDSMRPTTDIIKETLFNILQFNLTDISFLDLFAGCGGIGIEALSRGAAFAYFVDSSHSACEVINQNLEKTKLIDNAKTLCIDVRRIDESTDVCKYKYDIVFIDPPYESNLYETALKLIKNYNLLKENGIVILEMPIKKDTDFIEKLNYNIYRTKEYKSNKHIFCRNN